jgi:hypothetical protein
VAVGSLVAERFLVERRAGSGASGVVFRAIDQATGEPVALKVFHRTLRGDREQEEARILAQIVHPAVVRYVAHGRAEDGAFFLAMEWIEGEGLDARLARGALAIEEAIVLGARVAEGLAAAHALKSIHRDLKPSNLLLRGGAVEGAAIIDFGVARGAKPTRGDAPVGTPGYMAPEQARGQRDLDARVDVFSLGAVLYECVSGRPAFAGEHAMAVLAKVLLEDPPHPGELRAGVPRALDDLIIRMLAKDRDDRPRDAEAVARALATLRTPVKPLSVAPRPRGLGSSEQRLVSVAMAGGGAKLADSTALAAQLAAFGARVEELENGAVVATLAGAGAATDQAASAARSALALRAALPDRAIALATGRGVVSARSPVGEVIDRAARMLALGGPIRIDEITAGLLDPRFEVSGDEQGLLLAGELSEVEAPRALLGRPAPFFGRDAEIALVIDRIGRAFADREARVVLVTGPDGAGKSRLLRAILEALAAIGPLPTTLAGYADRARAQNPFGMIAPALRRVAGVHEREPASVRQQKIRARATRHLRDPAQATRVAEFACEIAGAPLPDESSVAIRAARRDPVLLGDQVRRAFEDLLAAECAAGPVLITLEDLDAADPPSLGLIGAALGNLRRAPLFVLATARPEVHEVFPGLWAAYGIEEVPLGPLPKEASVRVVQHALGPTATPPLVERLVERAAGNPFYLEELIRHTARLGPRSAADPLPATVLAMIEASLASLAPEARRVLRAASVFGQTFTRGGVLALLGEDDAADATAAADTRLVELCEREIFVPTGDAAAEDPELSFRTAAVRDAAYATLTAEDRALGHALAGAWLERHGSADAAAMAAHFERGGDAERAAHHLGRAAEQALAGNDFEGAVALAERGIRALPSGSAAAGPLFAIAAAAHRWRGRNAEAQRCGVAAMAVSPAASAAWYAAAAELAVASTKLGDGEQLAAVAEALRVFADRGANGPLFAIACARTATQLLYGGRRDLAEELFAALDACDASDPGALARVEQARAIRALYGGDLEDHVARMEASARAFEAAGDLRNASAQRVNVVFAKLEEGAYEEVEQATRAAAASADRMGLVSLAALARCNLGAALLALGQRAEAGAVTEAAARAFAAQGDKRMEGATRNNLALVRLAEGDLEGAASEARAAIEALAASPPARAYALATLARVQLARGTAHSALETAREAVMAALGGIEEGESAVLLAHAEALWAVGERVGAATAIAGARARLLERARRITDPGRRARFLGRVAENARTLELAQAWVGD